MRIFSILLLLTLLACEKKEENSILSRGNEYTPTQEGLEREYRIREINQFGNTKDTTIFYLRESIGQSLVNGDEVLTELLRYKKNSLEDEYVFDSLWSFTVRDDFTIITENNKRRIQIQFPIYKDLIFDENQYNTASEFNLFQKSGFTKEVESGTYSSCVSTFRNDLSNLIETIRQDHFFAKDIGLIYSEKIDLSHQPGGDTIGSYYLKELISVEQK